MENKIIKAVQKINPTAEVSVSGEDINSIVWENGTTPISKADIEAKMAELQAEYDALGYARARKQEYPNVDDFMEAYTEKEIGGNSSKWDEYVIKYNKVRSDNPKL
jgi:hypothetical protein